MLRIIDTETCGLRGGIVEIASVGVINGKIVNPMSHLVRPDRPVSPQAMAIHHITEAIVADKPWIEGMVPHYCGSKWYVTHNVSFDRRVLPKMLGKWIYIMKLARRLWPGIKHNNMTLYKVRGLSIRTSPSLHHHRTLYNCYITAVLLVDIINTSGWTVRQMADITGRPSLMTTSASGRYHGKAAFDVTERDPDYLRWLFNNLDSVSPGLRLALKHYLENT